MVLNRRLAESGERGNPCHVAGADQEVAPDSHRSCSFQSELQSACGRHHGKLGLEFRRNGLSRMKKPLHVLELLASLFAPVSFWGDSDRAGPRLVDVGFQASLRLNPCHTHVYPGAGLTPTARHGTHPPAPSVEGRRMWGHARKCSYRLSQRLLPLCVGGNERNPNDVREGLSGGHLYGEEASRVSFQTANEGNLNPLVD